jgi:hypothetical protein
MDDPRPTLRCLVAWPLPNGDHIVRRSVVTLDDAAQFRAFGWHLLIDPASEQELARWEQLHRPHPKWQRW